MITLQKYILDMEQGRDLSDAGGLLDAIGRTSDEDSIRSLFLAWDKKGISEEDIYSLAKEMRSRCLKVSTKHRRHVDVVGSGGSRAKTFNVSTAAAFVVAGAGVAVAKHGNRAATSSSGSTDVLAELGILATTSPELLEHCLDELGICFLFAPSFHSLPPLLGKVRRGLGSPTVFNCVGPLCNPAAAPHQLIGAWNLDAAEKMAKALARLGTGRSWVVHSEDGLDEIGVTRDTQVLEVHNERIKRFRLRPADFGLRSTNGHPPRANSAAESAAIVRDVLENRSSGMSAESLVLVNAAAALYLCGQADDLPQAMEMATDSVRSGRAAEKLTVLAEAMTRQ